MGVYFSEAMIALAQANFHSATGDFAKNQQQEVRAKSNVRVDTVVANTAGVSLPEFTLRGVEKERLDDKELLGQRSRRHGLDSQADLPEVLL